jgi:peptidoglycan/xylan/chitin deacetylase (PgdA/CDA1 family)
MKTLATLALLCGMATTQAYVEVPTETSMQKDLRDYNKERIHIGTKEIVITIDDGPTRGVTDKILDTLKKHNVQATFFVIASKVNKNRDIFQRMLDEGHIVANHTMTHANLANIRGLFKTKKLKEELLGAHDAIESYMGNSSKYYFRAPYGAWTPKAAKVINKSEHGANYFGPVFWDIGGDIDGSLFKVKKAADWACWSKRWSVNKCFKGYKNETEQKKGGVVLFHDLNKKSAELIEKYVEEFSDRPDYDFVSLDEVKL